MRADDDDVLRADLIQQLMCQGAIDIAALERRYDIDFCDYFATRSPGCSHSSTDGLVEIDADARSRPRRAGACCCVSSPCASTATSTSRRRRAPRATRRAI